MNLTPQEKEFLTSYLRLHFPKETYALLLFGSYAAETAKPTSDIDIAIKGSGPLDAADWQKALSFFEDSTFAKKVDLIDFHRVSAEFQKIILQHAKALD